MASTGVLCEEFPHILGWTNQGVQRHGHERPSPPRQRKSEPSRPSPGQGLRDPKGQEKRSRAPKEDPRRVGPWKLGKTIGRGFSGRVKIAKHTITGHPAAVKILPRHLVPNSRMSINQAEIVIMKLIDHPNVMKLYDVYDNLHEIFLVMEYVEGGELFEFLVSRGRLSEDEALNYFQQIIRGVDYCHRFNICHRDLKPENLVRVLLLDKANNIKIADFGMAVWEASGKLLETSCGSPHYASPEIVAGINYHGSSSDIWSCGVILFALLTGRLPFDDENLSDLLTKVRIGVFQMPPDISGPVQDLIRGMLTVDPTKRLTMDEIQSHPWFTRVPPKPLPSHIIAPTREQMSKSFGRPEELDPDIVFNLQTLWGGAEKDLIVDALVTNALTRPLCGNFTRQSWEKVFYFLLARYKQHHLDNFADDAVEFSTPAAAARTTKSKSKKPPREHIVRTGAGAVRSRSRQSIASLNRRSTAAPRAGANGTSHLVATRPAPSTPGTVLETASKATGFLEGSRRAVSPSPDGKTPTTPRNLKPRAEVPMSHGTYSAIKSRQTSAATPKRGADQVVASAVPRILLQEATPSPAQRRQRDSVDVRTGSFISKPDITPSPSPKPVTSPTASIRIPQTEDPAMRRFFHDIVDQLQTMSNRSPNLHEGALGGSAPTSPFLDSDGFDSCSGVNQFEDAEENDSGGFESYEQENSSSRSLSHSQRRPDGKRTSGFVLVDDSSRIPSAVNQNSRIQKLSMLRPHRTQPRAKQPSLSGWNTEQESEQYPDLYDKTSTRGQSSSQRSKKSINLTANKENSHFSTYRPVTREPKVNKGKGKAVMGLTIEAARHYSPGFDPSSEGSRKSSRSSRRSKGQFSILLILYDLLTDRFKMDIFPGIAGSPSPLSPASSAFTDDAGLMSPKISWFTNLFSWKQPSYRLMSLESCEESRVEAKGLLEDLGCLVLVERYDAGEVLKCQFEDHSGGSLRPVKFKVEFIGQQSGSTHEIQTIGGTTQFAPKNPLTYQTCMSLTMEKGSAPSFKSICNALRKLWDLDLPNHPPVGLGSTTRKPPH
ncbi:CAMK/CAMKL/GIN4 protein kinase [Puccinia sorghi]|uniref:non-specific serine/threonine protein kinase n=1 Tax=Puccinia sorghi TaxID=27349 RepID=A0A0L6UJZ2_9BASI|nr:CAMK/CAMKL/GIN4 protein kinase [Puccinia sorghi]